jgi:uncharacterized protein
MNVNTANARLQKIIEFVLANYKDTEAGGLVTPASLDYRWKQTLRVTQYGRLLAEEEKADLELVLAACLLHDVAKFSPGDHGLEHGRNGARIARPLLETLGYSQEQIDNICFSIAVHVDDKADFDHPITLESKIVSDADNIDRFGAYRILMRFHEDVDDYEKLICSAEQRLLTLKKYREQNIMGTPAGKRLFNQQLDLQILFLERLVADSRLTILPEL